MPTGITVRSLKLAILECLINGRGSQHKFNLIGKGYSAGPLEGRLGTRLEPAQRRLAVLAFDELVAADLIRPTYTDLADPESWVEVTDAGREAFGRQQLDDLDAALAMLAPRLVDLRAGAWSAVESGRPDALRQAAHSGRELIDQVLHEGAPDAVVKEQPWYQPVSDSRSGVSRRQRLKHLMAAGRGPSGSDLEVAETACDLVLAIDRRLTALSHGRGETDARDIRDALTAAELALQRILIPSQ